MKNVNLTGLYLALVAKFGVTGFELTSIVPQNTETKEPIDAMIDFYGGNVVAFDLSEIGRILNENITGEIKQATASLKSDKIHIYIEFTNSEFKD